MRGGDKMDIKEKVQEIVEKVSSDKTLLAEFQKEPVKVVEKVVGVDLPDDVVNKVIDGVKVALATNKLGDVADTLKKLF